MCYNTQVMTHAHHSTRYSAHYSTCVTAHMSQHAHVIIHTSQHPRYHTHVTTHARSNKLPSVSGARRGLRDASALDNKPQTKETMCQVARAALAVAELPEILILTHVL